MSPRPATEGTDRILAKMVAWAGARDDVRALALVGSRARTDHAADRWSDLDVVAMARRPARYRGSAGWLAEIETPWLAIHEPTPIGGQQIHHVIFEGGAKLDLVVVSSRAFSIAARAVATLRRRPSAARLLPALARERLTALAHVTGHGIRFVLDKDGIGDRLGSGAWESARPPVPPSQEEFLDLVRHFLTEQVSVALKLGRGEVFLAKAMGEPRLTELLLRMLEWHTQVTSDRWSPVFERGRFLDEWAPPGVIERLRGTFARYDPTDVRRARLEALDLFRELAQETGAQLGYAYPKQLEETVMAWVRSQAGE